MNPTSPQAQAHADAGPTELAARRRIAPIAGNLRGRVLAAVAAAGDDGLTAVEATEALHYNMAQLYSVAPRFAELIRDGYVRIGGRRGDRQFYVCTDAGHAWAEGPEAKTHSPCCSAHGVPMTCKRYRRSHFVEVRPCCSIDAVALRAQDGAA